MIRKIILKVIVFVLVMTGTAFVVNKLSNSNSDSISWEMDEPTLPLVYCHFEGEQINMMQGYTQIMSTGLMRDGIVPINEEYGVDLLVEDTGDYGVSYSYQLRSIAGDSLVEEGDIVEWNNNQGYKEFKVRFRMDMSQNQEYVLVFIITNAEGESARYYTRVVNIEEQYGVDILKYVMEFHDTTFIKDVDEEIGNMVYNALDVKAASVDDDIYHVNLNSSYDMVTWGGIKPAVMTGIVPTITEIDNEYAVIKLSYVVEGTSAEVNHLYNVEEYYSARYDRMKGQVEILAFDRYIESYFDENYISKARNSICVGIANPQELEYVSTEDNRKLAFVKEGELWYYDYDTSVLTSVFSLPQSNYSDIRLLNTDIDVNIVDMDEDGNIYFVVYGYMSRGAHEGRNGLIMYKFTSVDMKLEELFFVESDEPYDVMRQEIGRLTYYDPNGYFYYLLNGAIYKVDMTDGTQDTVVYGIPSDKYLISDNRKVVAYPNTAKDEDVTSISIYNFETGQMYVQSGTATDRFLGLGFVGNDLIYGVAHRGDITVTSDGEATLPLYKIYIIQPDGNVIKEYSQSGVYIMNAQVQGEKIYLTRANKMNNFYQECEPDYISYKKDEVSAQISTSYNYSSVEMNQVDIVFPSNIYLSESVEHTITKNKKNDEYWELKVKTETSVDSFFVFNNSGYVGEYNSAGRAILAVDDEDSGLVVDSDGNTIYRSIAAVSYNTVADFIDEMPCKNLKDTLMTCAYMCVEYVDNRVEYEDIMACESWESAFAEYTNGVGINISGISLDIALYFLDRDVPFAACIDDGRYVLVISYNSTHIRYYDPLLGEEVKVTREEFEEALSVQGNTMYTYTSQ
ncbi:MAG: hypothetical protein E7258_03545 [Lachnospiraceae bacterium]|nr:hypothetical protein [Lachnospiraceae bacterium]